MKPHEVYTVQMSEAKLRLLAAEKVSRAVEPLTGVFSLDSEFCFLQIRKVIELITFSGMIREEGRYRKFRENERKKETDRIDPTKDWKAAQILSRLVKLSPHVLPIPLGAAIQVGVDHTHFERESLTVNHGRLIELYGKCSAFMHVANPLVEDYLAHIDEQRQQYIEAPAVVEAALVFLRKLLWRHAVVQIEWTDPDNPTVPDTPTSAWVIEFGTTDDATVNVILATA